MAGGGGEQDLNLVPYMDIMVNLIMFMIVVTAYIVELREAPVLAPALRSGGGGGDTEEKQKPFLTVAVSTKSIAILGSTDEVPAAELPMEGTQYPFAQLTELLTDYKAKYGVADNLVITAEGSVPYTVLIQTMDAARKDAKKNDLFPGVTLGIAVAGK